jgi:hypothetical protein
MTEASGGIEADPSNTKIEQRAVESFHRNTRHRHVRGLPDKVEAPGIAADHPVRFRRPEPTGQQHRPAAHPTLRFGKRVEQLRIHRPRLILPPVTEKVGKTPQGGRVVLSASHELERQPLARVRIHETEPAVSDAGRARKRRNGRAGRSRRRTPSTLRLNRCRKSDEYGRTKCGEQAATRETRGACRGRCIGHESAPAWREMGRPLSSDLKDTGKQRPQGSRSWDGIPDIRAQTRIKTLAAPWGPNSRGFRRDPQERLKGFRGNVRLFSRRASTSDDPRAIS